MKNYNDLVKKMASETIIRTNKDVFGKSFAERKLNEKIEEKTLSICGKLSSTFEREIAELVSSIISYNVNDQGLIIKGKRNNIALSKYGLIVLMNRSNSLKRAGRLSAYQFSDDYRKACTINEIPEIAPDECTFMREYSEFDALSAWYKRPIDFLPSSLDNESYISAVIDKPFTAYPNLEWSDAENNNNEYLEGYFQSLFNSCSDLLRTISWTQNRRYGSLFSTEVKDTKEPHHEKVFIQIKYIMKYIDEWKEIDNTIYYLVSKLNTDNNMLDRNEVIEMLMSFNDLRVLIQRHFKTFKNCDIGNLILTSLYNMPYEKAISQVDNSPGDIEKNKYILHSLLNEIRVCYEDLRIEALTNYK